jgi:uncharacterized protein (TIRG00374 family)
MGGGESGDGRAVLSPASLLAKAVHVLASLDPAYLAATIALYYLGLLLYSLRLVVISGRLGLHIPLRVAYAANLAGVAAANILPSMQVLGEAVKAGYVRWRLGRGLPEVTAAIIYDKVVEAVPLAAIALAGLTASTPHLHSYATAIAALSTAMIAVAVAGWEKVAEKASKILERRGYRIPREKLESLIHDRELAAVTATLAAATWLLIAARIYTAALAAGVTVTPHQALLLTLAYVAASAPAVTPGSIGLVEPTLTLAIQELTGAPTDRALAATLAERTASYISATAVGLAVVAAAGAWDIIRKPLAEHTKANQQQI